MNRIEQHIKSLEYFKDWSNYLLVTTVAALGWVASKDSRLVDVDIEIWCFALSTVFGIFTLALVPIVAAQITNDLDSFYEVRPRFRLFWLWGDEVKLPIKAVCWPQHIFLLLVFLCILSMLHNPSVRAVGCVEERNPAATVDWLGFLDAPTQPTGWVFSRSHAPAWECIPSSPTPTNRQ